MPVPVPVRLPFAVCRGAINPLLPSLFVCVFVCKSVQGKLRQGKSVLEYTNEVKRGKR